MHVQTAQTEATEDDLSSKKGVFPLAIAYRAESLLAHGSNTKVPARVKELIYIEESSHIYDPDRYLAVACLYLAGKAGVSLAPLESIFRKNRARHSA